MIAPGIDIKFRSSRLPDSVLGDTGTVLIPIADADYGAAKGFISIFAAEPDANMALIGHTVQDMPVVREALKVAGEVIIYILAEGTKATATDVESGITATAKYGGVFGNSLEFTITENPVAGFDVAISRIGTGTLEEFASLNTIDELMAAGSQWLDFAGTAESPLAAIAGLVLAGGANGRIYLTVSS